MRGLLFALSILTVATTEAQTLDAVVDSIMAHNPQLQLAQCQGIAKLTEIKAETTFEPTEVEYSPFFVRGMNGMASSELVVSQSLRTPWAYAMNGKVARTQSQANNAELEALTQDLRIAARCLCLDIVGLNELMAVKAERLAAADSLLAVYDRASEQGLLTALDVNRLRVERMDVQNAFVQTQAARDKALHHLREMAGGHDISLQGVSLPDTIAVTTPASFSTDLYSNDNPQSLTASADLRIVAAARQAEVARQREKAVRADWLSSLTIGYRRNTDGGVATHGVLIGGSLPLFGNGSSRAVARRRVEEAEAQVRITLASIERERLDLNTELQLSLNKLRATDVSVVRETLQMLHRSLATRAISLPQYLASTAPLYEKLEERISTIVVLHQTLAALNREVL